MNDTTTNKPLLEVKNLKTYFFTEDGVVKAVDGVDFYVNQGEVLGLVGESGCGKSVTSLSIMRLLGVPGKVVDGQIHFAGSDLLKLPEDEMVKMRGNRMSMIFQQPQTSLNPVFTVGDQVAEVLQIHQNMNKEAAWNRAVELLAMVGIPDAARKAKAYPHEMSGGQAQRVMIAMALALAPELLIADEPTTALDVTIQAQILDLIRKLVRELNTSLILITHDLGVVAEMAQRMAVMYAGRIVELGTVEEVFEVPRHPYTRGLMDSIPRLDGRRKQQLHAIEGVVPDLAHLPPGCTFAGRCEYAQADCRTACPQLASLEGGRLVACHHPLGGMPQ